MEEGRLASRMKAELLDENLNKVCGVLAKLLDRDIFPWLEAGKTPTDHERDRAATIVADRVLSATTKNVIREAHRKRQLADMVVFLDSIGYRQVRKSGAERLRVNDPGTFAIDVSVPVAMGRVGLMPIDFLIQPKTPGLRRMPILVDLGSFQDHRDAVRQANWEVKKRRALQMTYGQSFRFVLLLGGHIGTSVLGRLAAESIDWVWQYQIGQRGAFAHSFGRVAQNLTLQLG
jgi:hypothetical protein